jgi:hypothetical protein
LTTVLGGNLDEPSQYFAEIQGINLTSYSNPCTLNFNNLNDLNFGLTMFIYIGLENVAVFSGSNAYIGNDFTFNYMGVEYSGVFTSGNAALTQPSTPTPTPTKTPTPTPTPTLTFNTTITASDSNDLGFTCNSGVDCPPGVFLPGSCCGLTGQLEYFQDIAVVGGVTCGSSPAPVCPGVNFGFTTQNAILKFTSIATIDTRDDLQANFNISSQYVGSTSFKQKYVGQPLEIQVDNNRYSGVFSQGTIDLTLI